MVTGEQQTGPVWLGTAGYIVVGTILFFIARAGRRRSDRKAQAGP